jgi:hypothetical protein
MRVFARRERPHPGAQLTLFEAGDGWRYSLWATNRPASTKGWLGQAAYIDAAHRVQARVEDAIRTGKNCGIGHFPSFDFGINAAWLTAAMTGQILLAWLKLLVLVILSFRVIWHCDLRCLVEDSVVNETSAA